MDWVRAKSILIAMLLALNLFMAGYLINRELGDSADRAFYTNVTGILEGRGVSVNCKFPKSVTASGLLIYGDGARFVEGCAAALNASGAAGDIAMPGRESLHYTNSHPDEGLNTGSHANLDADVRKTLRDMGIDISRFKTDNILAAEDSSGGYFLQYILEYDGKLVFDSNVKAYVTPEGGISELTINYREIKAAPDDKHMKVVPAYQVILKNYHNSGDAISSISIGFMGQNTARENPFMESEEGAVWRVRLEDGTERFFEAAYGDEI